MPIQKKTETTIFHFQVGEYLSPVHREDAIDGFVFNDDSVLNQHIDSISGIDLDFLLADRENHFTRDLESSFSELIRKAFLVSGLQEAWPERPMHLDRGINDC